MNIDVDDIRLMLATQLPERARWIAAGPSAFDFSRTRSPLQRVTPTDINDWEVPHEWTRLILFGEWDYAEGGGARPFIGIDEGTREIVGLDVESDTSPIFFFNSDAAAFVRTFRAFDDAFRLPGFSSDCLRSLLAVIEPARFRASGWQAICEVCALACAESR